MSVCVDVSSACLPLALHVFQHTASPSLQEFTQLQHENEAHIVNRHAKYQQYVSDSADSFMSPTFPYAASLSPQPASFTSLSALSSSNTSSNLFERSEPHQRMHIVETHISQFLSAMSHYPEQELDFEEEKKERCGLNLSPWPHASAPAFFISPLLDNPLFALELSSLLPALFVRDPPPFVLSQLVPFLLHQPNGPAFLLYFVSSRPQHTLSVVQHACQWMENNIKQVDGKLQQYVKHTSSPSLPACSALFNHLFILFHSPPFCSFHTFLLLLSEHTPTNAHTLTAARQLVFNMLSAITPFTHTSSKHRLPLPPNPLTSLPLHYYHALTPALHFLPSLLVALTLRIQDEVEYLSQHVSSAGKSSSSQDSVSVCCRHLCDYLRHSRLSDEFQAAPYASAQGESAKKIKERKAKDKEKEAQKDNNGQKDSQKSKGKEGPLSLSISSPSSHHSHGVSPSHAQSVANSRPPSSPLFSSSKSFPSTPISPSTHPLSFQSPHLSAHCSPSVKPVSTSSASLSADRPPTLVQVMNGRVWKKLKALCAQLQASNHTSIVDVLTSIQHIVQFYCTLIYYCDWTMRVKELDQILRLIPKHNTSALLAESGTVYTAAHFQLFDRIICFVAICSQCLSTSTLSSTLSLPLHFITSTHINYLKTFYHMPSIHLTFKSSPSPNILQYLCVLIHSRLYLRAERLIGDVLGWPSLCISRDFFQFAATHIYDRATLMRVIFEVPIPRSIALDSVMYANINIECAHLFLKHNLISKPFFEYGVGYWIATLFNIQASAQHHVIHTSPLAYSPHIPATPFLHPLFPSILNQLICVCLTFHLELKDAQHHKRDTRILKENEIATIINKYTFQHFAYLSDHDNLGALIYLTYYILCYNNEIFNLCLKYSTSSSPLNPSCLNPYSPSILSSIPLGPLMYYISHSSSYSHLYPCMSRWCAQQYGVQPLPVSSATHALPSCTLALPTPPQVKTIFQNSHNAPFPASTILQQLIQLSMIEQSMTSDSIISSGSLQYHVLDYIDVVLVVLLPQLLSRSHPSSLLHHFQQWWCSLLQFAHVSAPHFVQRTCVVLLNVYQSISTMCHQASQSQRVQFMHNIQQTAQQWNAHTPFQWHLFTQQLSYQQLVESPLLLLYNIPVSSTLFQHHHLFTFFLSLIRSLLSSTRHFYSIYSFASHISHLHLSILDSTSSNLKLLINTSNKQLVQTNKEEVMWLSVPVQLKLLSLQWADRESTYDESVGLLPSLHRKNQRSEEMNELEATIANMVEDKEETLSHMASAYWNNQDISQLTACLEASFIIAMSLLSSQSVIQHVNPHATSVYQLLNSRSHFDTSVDILSHALSCSSSPPPQLHHSCFNDFVVWCVSTTSSPSSLMQLLHTQTLPLPILPELILLMHSNITQWWSIEFISARIKQLFDALVPGMDSLQQIMVFDSYVFLLHSLCYLIVMTESTDSLYLALLKAILKQFLSIDQSGLPTDKLQQIRYHINVHALFKSIHPLTEVSYSFTDVRVLLIDVLSRLQHLYANLYSPQLNSDVLSNVIHALKQQAQILSNLDDSDIKVD